MGTVPRFVPITVSQQTSGPGIYLVTVSGITLTLDNFLRWNDPTAPIIVKNMVGAGANITVTANGGAGLIDGASSFTLNNVNQAIAFTPYQNGTSWIITA